VPITGGLLLVFAYTNTVSAHNYLSCDRLRTQSILSTVSNAPLKVLP